MRRRTATTLTALSVVGTQATRTRSAVVAAATLATVLAAPVAAHAETVTRTDPVEDVAVFGPDDGVRALGLTARYVDITRIAVDHRSANVITTMEVVDLSATAPGFEAIAALRTPEGRYDATVTFGGMSPVVATLSRGNGAPVPCDDVRGRIFRETGLVRIFVPRGCIGRPEAVRFGGRLQQQYSTGETLVDDARRATPVESRDTPIRIGPLEVARGES